MFMQLESGLYEDLLLCNHGELEPGRGRGCGETEGELHARCTLIEFGASSGLHTPLGSELAWNMAKGSPDLTGLLCPVSVVESEPCRTCLCHFCFSFLPLCPDMAGEFHLKETRFQTLLTRGLLWEFA